MPIVHERSFLNLFFQHELEFAHFPDFAFDGESLFSPATFLVDCSGNTSLLVALPDSFLRVCQEEGLNAPTFSPSQLAFDSYLLDILV